MLTIAGGVILGGLGLIVIFIILAALGEYAVWGCFGIAGIAVVLAVLGGGAFIYALVPPHERPMLGALAALGVGWAAVIYVRDKRWKAKYYASYHAKKNAVAPLASDLTPEQSRDAAKLAYARRDYVEPIAKPKRKWLEEEIPRWLARRIRALRRR